MNSFVSFLLKYYVHENFKKFHKFNLKKIAKTATVVKSQLS